MGTIKQDIEAIYKSLNVNKLLSFLGIEYEEKNNYFLIKCPQCQQKRAFIYKDNPVIQVFCNRKNSCGYKATPIQLIAGEQNPRGKNFSKALNTLKSLAGLSNNFSSYSTSLPRKPNKESPKKIIRGLRKKHKDLLILKKQEETSLLLFKKSKSKRTEKYLIQRGISIATAKEYNVGYAPFGYWLHKNEQGIKCRQWQDGRVIFPTEMFNKNQNSFTKINFYGRAMELKKPCKKQDRHDYLPNLPKGLFNLNCIQKYKSILVTEGVFDALSLIESGKKNTIAMLSCDNFNHLKENIEAFNQTQKPLQRVKNIAFCFDKEVYFDENSKLKIQYFKTIKEKFEGYKIFFLSPKIYDDTNSDLNNLWRKKKEIPLEFFDVK